MALTDLAAAISHEPDDRTRRRLVLQFLEGWHWEPPATRTQLLLREPATCGDERYDVLLAALAEHCAAQDGHAGPGWADHRQLETFWFPDDTPAGRVDALVHAPAALRRRGVFIAAEDLRRV